MLKGAEYLRTLPELGNTMDGVIEDTFLEDNYSIVDPVRASKIEQLIENGSIVALTDDEAQAHNEMLESLEEQGLPSPYQRTSDAHNELRENLVSR